LGCIRFIDGTLIDIKKPWKNEAHKTWFDGQNKYIFYEITLLLFITMVYSFIEGSKQNQVSQFVIFLHQVKINFAPKINFSYKF
jgi:hypothetical protein